MVPRRGLGGAQGGRRVSRHLQICSLNSCNKSRVQDGGYRKIFCFLEHTCRSWRMGQIGEILWLRHLGVRIWYHLYNERALGGTGSEEFYGYRLMNRGWC